MQTRSQKRAREAQGFTLHGHWAPLDPPAHVRGLRFVLDDKTPRPDHCTDAHHAVARIPIRADMTTQQLICEQRKLTEGLKVSFGRTLTPLLCGTIPHDVAVDDGGERIMWFAKRGDRDVLPIDVSAWFVLPTLPLAALPCFRSSARAARLRGAFEAISETLTDAEHRMPEQDHVNLYNAVAAAYRLAL